MHSPRPLNVRVGDCQMKILGVWMPLISFEMVMAVASPDRAAVGGPLVAPAASRAGR